MLKYQAPIVQCQKLCLGRNMAMMMVCHIGKFSGQADPITRLPYAAMRSRGGQQCIGWVDKPLFSRDGASLVFVYRVGRCKAAGPTWESGSYLFTVSVDGTGLWRCASSWQNRGSCNNRAPER